MSALATAVICFIEALYRETGREPERIVLPQRAFEMLASEVIKEAVVPDGDPITGMGRDGRFWLAATEIVPDVQCPVDGCQKKYPHLHAAPVMPPGITSGLGMLAHMEASDVIDEPTRKRLAIKHIESQARNSRDAWERDADGRLILWRPANPKTRPWEGHICPEYEHCSLCVEEAWDCGAAVLGGLLAMAQAIRERNACSTCGANHIGNGGPCHVRFA